MRDCNAQGQRVGRRHRCVGHRCAIVGILRRNERNECTQDQHRSKCVVTMSAAARKQRYIAFKLSLLPFISTRFVGAVRCASSRALLISANRQAQSAQHSARIRRRQFETAQRLLELRGAQRGMGVRACSGACGGGVDCRQRAHFAARRASRQPRTQWSLARAHLENHGSDQDDYEVIRKVGRGKYSEVFEGYSVVNDEKCVFSPAISRATPVIAA